MSETDQDISSKSDEMLCCYYSRYGKGINCDQVGKLPKLAETDLDENEVIIKVFASTVNPADYKQRQGETSLIMSTEFPQIHGFDFSGVVVCTRSSLFKVGDEVFGSTKGVRRGCIAEYAVIDAEVCCLKPPNVSHELAASVCLVGITSIMAFRECGLKEIDVLNNENHDDSPADDIRVLITGGAGGVGSIAIQIAKVLYNAKTVVTTASLGKKTEFVKSLGADEVIDYKNHDFSKELLLQSLDVGKESESLLFDAILDCTGECRKCVKLIKCRGGGMVSIVTAATSDSIQNWLSNSSNRDKNKITFGVQQFMNMKFGRTAMDFFSGSSNIQNQMLAYQNKKLSEMKTKQKNENRRKQMNKKTSIINEHDSTPKSSEVTTMSTNKVEEQKIAHKKVTFNHIIAGGNAEITKILAYLLANDKLKNCIEKVFPLYEADKAIAYVESKKAMGKVVINCQLTTPEQ